MHTESGTAIARAIALAQTGGALFDGFEAPDADDAEELAQRLADLTAGLTRGEAMGEALAVGILAGAHLQYRRTQALAADAQPDPMAFYGPRERRKACA